MVDTNESKKAGALWRVNLSIQFSFQFFMNTNFFLVLAQANLFFRLACGSSLLAWI